MPNKPEIAACRPYQPLSRTSAKGANLVMLSVAPPRHQLWIPSQESGYQLDIKKSLA
ncbi:hypothetical protein I79_025339 [Cricetulus griseus]|uniref:Uncharacterized protein n=1 Tax=Cricetulus griseus TaxID=10029 RepID=G3IN27_CRIGR|nr:hypothetical protein I79_025339 [Cricetulus griseus]